MNMPIIIRQGDVLLVHVPALPEGCDEVSSELGRIVLMHGEATGHAHVIVDEPSTTSIAERDGLSTRSTGTRSRRRARLLRAPDGTRYLEVRAPVTLQHEEHTEHVIPAGVYELPVQVEHTAERMLLVRD